MQRRSPRLTALVPAQRSLSTNLASCSDSYYIAHVKNACAFLNDGMSRLEQHEKAAHGRSRDLDNPEELFLGVNSGIVYARNRAPVQGAQWTGGASSSSTTVTPSTALPQRD